MEETPARAPQDAGLLTASSSLSATRSDVRSGHTQESLPITPAWVTRHIP